MKKDPKIKVIVKYMIFVKFIAMFMSIKSIIVVPLKKLSILQRMHNKCEVESDLMCLLQVFKVQVGKY
jgi:hypothetical protein